MQTAPELNVGAIFTQIFHGIEKIKSFTIYFEAHTAQ